MRQNRPDEIVLGLAFIGRSGHGEAGEHAPQSSLERGGVNVSPLVQARDRLLQIIVSEETAFARDVNAHATVVQRILE